MARMRIEYMVRITNEDSVQTLGRIERTFYAGANQGPFGLASQRIVADLDDMDKMNAVVGS